MTVSIDTNICKGVDSCPEGGLCIEICALNAVTNVDGKPSIDGETCPDCGLCVLNCPEKAISKT